MENELKGIADDGKVFTLESPEVVAYKAEFPDVTDEAAIGSVVTKYNNELSGANSAELNVEVEVETEEAEDEAEDEEGDEEDEVEEDDEEEGSEEVEEKEAE